MKIAIFGASGFIGSFLVPYLEKQGMTVLPFSRKKGAKYFWDPEKKIISHSLEGMDVVINLAGENIFGRWDGAKKETIKKSRLIATNFLVETIKTPLKLYVGASAIGYYGDRGLEILTEKSLQGEGFLARLCVELENEAKKIQAKRVVMLRLGVVIGFGGALEKMVPPFKMGLGGKLGDGSQVFSWIALEDVLRAILFIIENNALNGAINLVSLQPITNSEMTKILGENLQRPTILSMPKILLKVLFGESSEVYLSSTYVIPEKLQKEGFTFSVPTFDDALKKYL